jgi:hypothetical protein
VLANVAASFRANVPTLSNTHDNQPAITLKNCVDGQLKVLIKIIEACSKLGYRHPDDALCRA